MFVQPVIHTPMRTRESGGGPLYSRTLYCAVEDLPRRNINSLWKETDMHVMVAVDIGQRLQS